MAKMSAVDRAIAELQAKKAAIAEKAQGEILGLESAIAALKGQQRKPAKPRAVKVPETATA